LQVGLFWFFLVLLILPTTQTVAAVLGEHQDIWRVDLLAVTYLTPNDRNFSRLAYYRWENSRWVASDAETFFATQQSEIPLIVFAPGFTSTTPQTTKVGLGLVRNFDPEKPCRVVFWDWYSDRGPGNIRRDVRGKLPIADRTGDYLALFIQQLPPQSKVCLFGFSLGSRIVCQAAETLRRSGQQPEGLRLNLVLSAAATDQNLFARGQRHSRIPEIAEKILVTYNPDDWALKFYPLMYNHRDRAPALGYKGLLLQSISPAHRAQFENINVQRFIGDEHQTLYHVRTPVFRSRINAYFFFE